MSVGEQSSDSKQHTATWTDAAPGYQYEVPGAYDMTRMNADTDEVDLNDFFSRPLNIASYEWSTTVRYFQDFNPWSLYIGNTRVVNRLTNYNLLRAKLHVKFMINGNGFYYGKMLATYNPLHGNDDFDLNRALVPADMVRMSQKPHIYIDPTTSQGGEIICPFFYPKDNLNVVDGDWAEMGQINLREMNQLRHANGVTDSVTITVLAWLSDVVLAVPTANEPGALAPQGGIFSRPRASDETVCPFLGSELACCSYWLCGCCEVEEDLQPEAGMEKKGKKKMSYKANKSDEYGSGAISQPASTVARIAGMLTGAPIIGPYMRATEVIANSTASVAKMFGYSRPINPDPPCTYTPRFVPAINNVNINDTSEKLALDVKQELSIDNTIVGLDACDEMTVRGISTRESYLDKTTWTTSDSVGQTLFSLGVTPCLHKTYNPGAGYPTEYHFTACKYAATPFKYWRGSMKYRFQVVASNYHKGRLLIQWDPFGYSNKEMNVQYSQIVDIAEEKDFTVEIGWGNELGWLYVSTPFGDRYALRSDYAGTSADLNVNGVVTVSVLNTLTAANASAGGTVELNCIVSTGDDFEVAVPQSNWLGLLTPFIPEYEEESGMEETKLADGENTAEPSAPIQDQVVNTLGNNLSLSDANALVYHGETISSFRSCLKRYGYVGTIEAGEPGQAVATEYTMKWIPPQPGNIGANASWTDVLTPDGFNYNRMTLMSYLIPAFAAVRGGTRWKCVYLEDQSGAAARSDTSLSWIRLQNDSARDAGHWSNLPFVLSTAGATPTRSRLIPDVWNGMTVTTTKQNPCMEAEIPYQTQRRFMYAREVTNEHTTGDRMVAVGFCGHTPVAGAGFAAYVASAEDFNLSFYVGPPVYWDITFTPP